MEYRIIEGADRMDVCEVERLLKLTYWADKRSAETIEKSMRNSDCFGIRSGEDRSRAASRALLRAGHKRRQFFQFVFHQTRE